MDHLTILLLLLNLLAGTAILILILTRRRTGSLPILKPLAIYVAFFNILAFADLIYEYTITNLYGGDLFTMPLALTILLYCSVLLAEFGLVGSLSRVIAVLMERDLSRGFQIGLGVCFAFFTGAAILAIVILYSTREIRWIYFTHAGWISTMILLIYGLLINLLRSSAGGKRDHRRGFALIFMASYGFFTFSELNFYLFHLPIAPLDPLFLILANLAPLIWLMVYASSLHQDRSSAGGCVDFGEFCIRYGISPRESDIVDQIMDGKSNKEIEAALHISFNTVKNHVYNIFRKTGVSSRAQLILLIQGVGKGGDTAVAGTTERTSTSEPR